MSNTILNGWAGRSKDQLDPDYHFDEEKMYSTDLPAVLIIGKEGAEPRVFSEEEVKAMLSDLVYEMKCDDLDVRFYVEKHAATLGIQL